MTRTAAICTRKEWRVINRIRTGKQHSKGSAAAKTLLLGLGNTILSDDGVGIYVVRYMAERLPPRLAAVAEASLGGLELLETMKGFRKTIIVDAMVLPEGKPGTIERVDARDLEGGSAMSRHQVPFAQALELGRKLDMDLPDEIVIYGVRVKDTATFSERCTPEVAAAVPEIAARIMHHEWGISPE